jgi:3-phenylpropionate/cinnamic acid dioxygenase small subunit
VVASPEPAIAANLGAVVPYGSPLHNEIMGFLIEEARLLDHDEFERWSELFADDLMYTMPVRRTVLRKDGRGFDPGMMHFDDDASSMKIRIRRIMHTKSAYAEDPPSRVRRFLSSVVAHETEVDSEYVVESSVLLLRNRWDDQNYDLISVERQDLLRRSGPGFRLARRNILIDQTALGTPNLAIFI